MNIPTVFSCSVQPLKYPLCTDIRTTFSGDQKEQLRGAAIEGYFYHIPVKMNIFVVYWKIDDTRVCSIMKHDIGDSRKFLDAYLATLR